MFEPLARKSLRFSKSADAFLRSGTGLEHSLTLSSGETHACLFFLQRVSVNASNQWHVKAAFSSFKAFFTPRLSIVVFLIFRLNCQIRDQSAIV